MKFRLPDTPPPSPYDPYWEGVAEEWIPNSTPLSGPPLFDYSKDFPPLTRDIQSRNLPPIDSAPVNQSFYSTPLPPIASDSVEKSLSPLRDKLPSIDPFPSLPNINDFSRPITDLVDEKNNTIEITPKKIDLPPIGQKQLSKELNKLFPDVDETIKEKENSFKERIENIDELVERIGRNEESELTFEFEFFYGGSNTKFHAFVKRFGLTSENENFVEFLQSEYCKKILENNNLKIHIETGNIYYDDRDTNESIFQFIQNQQNITKGIIRHDFKFNGDLKQYYKWILNQFDAHEKTNYDILTFQNVKFLVYRYNDILASGGNTLIKIRHSQLTDDYLAAEEIQNQDWQYFIERILEVSNDPNAIESKEVFLKSTIENITVAKQIYKMMFNTISTNFNLVLPELSAEKIKNISEHFYLKNYSYSQLVTDLNDWISYYYSYGRFPGSNEFINVPYTKNPHFLTTREHLSPANLHKKFFNSDVIGLTSFHALCALNIYFGGDKNISALTYGEFLQNMTYQALSQENDEVEVTFDQSVNLTRSIVEALNNVLGQESELTSEISDRVNSVLDLTFDSEDELSTIESNKTIVEPIATSTPLTDKEINSLYEQEKKDPLKTSLQINAVDLDSAAEKANIENQKLYQEIINPTPGLIVDDKFDIENQFSSIVDLNRDKKFSNAMQIRLNRTLEKAREKINSVYFPSPAIEEIPNNTTYAKEDSIPIEDIYIDDSLKDLAKPIYFPQPSTDDRNDFKLDLKDDQMIIFKSPFLDTSISIQKEDLNNILENIIEDLNSNLKNLKMSATDTQETKQKKVIVKNIIEKLDKTPNKNIENQLESQKWLQNLVDDQLRIDNFFPFGNYTGEEYKNKFKNVTKRKRRRQKATPMSWSASEEPSVNALLLTNKLKKIQTAKNIFSNVIKNVPPENYKKFKIEYDPSNNITVDEDEF